MQFYIREFFSDDGPDCVDECVDHLNVFLLGEVSHEGEVLSVLELSKLKVGYFILKIC
jgi:hypothetical protein